MNKIKEIKEEIINHYNAGEKEFAAYITGFYSGGGRTDTIKNICSFENGKLKYIGSEVPMWNNMRIFIDTNQWMLFQIKYRVGQVYSVPLPEKICLKIDKIIIENNYLENNFDCNEIYRRVKKYKEDK